MKKRDWLIIGAFLAVLCGVVYANALSGEFVWDDMLLIMKNEHITGLRHAPAILREDLFHMTDEATGYYRPAQVFSYMADHLLWGKTPFGYHLMSLVLQVMNGLLVFYLVLLVSESRWQALFVAAVFCVHPAFVPIVAYISGRADLLGMLFSLASICAIVRYRTRGGGSLVPWLAVPLYALAVVSKELYVMTPLFIILYLLIFRGEKRSHDPARAIVGVMFGTALVYALLRATVLNFHQSMGAIATQPFPARLAIFPWVVKNYLVTLLMPVTLSMEKQLVYGSLFEPRFIISWVVPVGIGLAGWWLYRRGERQRLFWLGWFALGIMPVSNLLMPLKVVWADHWVYMASIGLFGLISSYLPLTGEGRRSKPLRVVTIICAGAYLLFLSVATVYANRHWHDEGALYSWILETSPGSARTLYNQGKLYEERGDLAKALEYYNAAIGDSPNPKAMYLDARGLVYKKLGDPMRARRDFEAAVARAPKVAIYHNNLGCNYAEAGMMEMARRQWEEALRYDPDNELALKNLGVIKGR